MKNSKFILTIGIAITIIIICVIISVVISKNSNSNTVVSTTYTLSCINGSATRSIQFSGPFYIKTSEAGVGYYTLKFYNAFGLKLLTQVYASGPSPRYFVPPLGATYFEYTFTCS